MHITNPEPNAAPRLVPVADEGLAIFCRDGAGVELTRPNGEIPVALIVPFDEHGRRRAVLVRAPGSRLSVNGYAPLDVRLLEHEDELLIRGVRLRFFAHTQAEVIELPAERAGALCARCLVSLATGDRVVACPACSALYHAGARTQPGEPARQCWEYHDAGCIGCGRSRKELAGGPEGRPDA